MQHLSNSKEIKTTVNQFDGVGLNKKKNNTFTMRMQRYKNKILDKEIDRKILKSEEDYNNGRVRKAEDVFKEWKTKYGI